MQKRKKSKISNNKNSKKQRITFSFSFKTNKLFFKVTKIILLVVIYLFISPPIRRSF